MVYIPRVYSWAFVGVGKVQKKRGPSSVAVSIAQHSSLAFRQASNGRQSVCREDKQKKKGPSFVAVSIAQHSTLVFRQASNGKQSVCREDKPC